MREYLSCLHSLQPTAKVVIVSNYTFALDDVEQMAEVQGWKILRIDGNVPSSKRQSLVDSFNLKLNDTFLFLLSARAGGLGLNLTAASRLFMLDCDWNPATDRQAMARIWRQGQTKPVFIYRLVAARTIEEAILQRQSMKSKLNSLVGDDAETEDIVENEEDLVSNELKFKTKTDIRRLLSPRWANYGHSVSSDIEDPALHLLMKGVVAKVSFQYTT
jgi:SNF2 family DNA or RNA helicase